MWEIGGKMMDKGQMKGTEKGGMLLYGEKLRKRIDGG